MATLKLWTRVAVERSQYSIPQRIGLKRPRGSRIHTRSHRGRLAIYTEHGSFVQRSSAELERQPHHAQCNVFTHGLHYTDTGRDSALRYPRAHPGRSCARKPSQTSPERPEVAGAVRPCRLGNRPVRSDSSPALPSTAQHRRRPGRRPGLRRPERVWPGPVPDPDAGPAGAGRHPFFAVLRWQHRLRALANGSHDRAPHGTCLDSRERRNPFAAGRRHGCNGTPRRRLQDSGDWKVGPRAARKRRPAGQEGIRVFLWIPRSPACPPAVHGPSVQKRRISSNRRGTGLRQRPVHEGGLGVPPEGRPTAILPVSELHGAARGTAGAGGFACRGQGTLS